MKKVYRLDGLGCAHCAAKMEEAIGKLDGVELARINFIAQKLTLEAADDAFDACLEKAQKICKRLEPDCKIIL